MSLNRQFKGTCVLLDLSKNLPNGSVSADFSNRLDLFKYSSTAFQFYVIMEIGWLAFTNVYSSSIIAVPIQFIWD